MSRDEGILAQAKRKARLVLIDLMGSNFEDRKGSMIWNQFRCLVFGKKPGCVWEKKRPKIRLWADNFRVEDLVLSTGPKMILYCTERLQNIPLSSSSIWNPFLSLPFLLHPNATCLPRFLGSDPGDGTRRAHHGRDSMTGPSQQSLKEYC